MRRHHLLLISVALGLFGCGSDPIAPPLTRLPRELSLAEQQLIAADNSFGFRLFGTVVGDEPDTANVFLSPLSASMALGMTMNGAAGTTLDAMRETLGFGSLALPDINASYRSLIALLQTLDAGVQWELANSVWYRQDYVFRQSFLDATQVFFNAQVRPLDFTAPGAAGTINAWVSDRTHGRIPEIVPSPLPGDAIMYLINAIYFKGAWRTRFDPAQTRPEAFHLADGSVVSVSTMRHADPMPVRTGGDGDVTVLELPYARGAYAMTIVMPAQASGIDSLLDGLTEARWNGWMAGLHDDDRGVALPKFTMRYGRNLNSMLAALGMGIAFCDGGAFNFTAMDPSGRACITNVLQKTFVLVNEEGTEAAAATSVEIGVTSAPPGPIVVDRPFVFALRERLSGTILFLGVIRNPLAN